MISYRPFWETLKRKNISQYRLEEELEINKGLMQRLRHNVLVNLTSIDQLCKALDCQPGDIIEYIPDKEPEEHK